MEEFDDQITSNRRDMPVFNDENFSISAVSLPETGSLFSGSADTSSMSMSIRGPGSLAGKVILNLGRITLKGVERMIIYRKLYAISSQSRNETRSPEMYNDILELSRPGMYSDTIHLEATRFLVRQIACGRTKRLVDALKNWHPIEVRLLLSELIARFDEVVQSPSRPIDSVMRAYKLNLPTSTVEDKEHSFVLFIYFLRNLVSTTSSFSLSSIVFEAGLLDFLLHLYATGFRDHLAPSSERTEYHRKSALSIACNSLLVAACENDHDGMVTAHIQRHPIYALWSMHPALPLFSYDIHDNSANAERMLRRREAWRGIEKRWVCWRISSIHDMMADFSRHFEEHFLRDVFVDCVQFAGSDLFADDDQLAFRALRSLHQLLHHEHYWPDTKFYLYDDYPLMYAKQIFTRVVQRLTALVENPFHPYFFFDFDMPLFRQTVVVHFIQWMSRTASGDLAFRRLMVSSGIVGLIEVTSRRSNSLIYDPQNDLDAEQAQYRQRFLTWAPLVFKSKDLNSPPPLERWRREEVWDDIAVRPQNTTLLYEWIDHLEEG
ncbi:hypothetical protein VKT23_015972 [Stygiomarasmius scandens]|uniref:Uncharacterized protein n=1 Tax=Marasmiellus scandens TaxID=2682957 RepID=A0ABR1IYA9_9AGAR